MNDGRPTHEAAMSCRDRERLQEAWAQVQRERERYRRMAARAAALETDLAAVRNSAAFRITYPLRWLVSAIPPSIYARLRGRGQRDAPAEPPRRCVLTGDRPWALLVDDWLPEPDRDSGSIDILHMAESLRALNFEVVFGARRELAGSDAKRAALETRGVHTLQIENAPDLDTFLREEGSRLTMVVLNRVYCGGELFETVRSFAPQAAILFNTVDLHWVRLEREAALHDDEALAAAAARARSRELFLAREADAVIVVSESEHALLLREAPDAFAVELPLARPLAPPVNQYSARNGIGFIGGFKHKPNLDALTWFASEIWPLVLHELPHCRLSVVGSDLPTGALAGVPGQIEILGHVPDVGPWFESIRLSVAPLRFGAGAKGKVASSLAAGVPCVGTSIALEGMRLNAQGVFVADTAAEMAQAIARLHEDAVLWSRFSEAALTLAAERFSIERWRERLAGTLATLGALPPPAPQVV